MPSAIDFPRPFLHDARLDFSFSGLKTAVTCTRRKELPAGTGSTVPPLTPQQRVADLAASFQAAVIDVTGR